MSESKKPKSPSKFDLDKVTGETVELDDGRLVFVGHVSKEEGPPTGGVVVRITSPPGTPGHDGSHPSRIRIDKAGNRVTTNAYTAEVMRAINRLTEGV